MKQTKIHWFLVSQIIAEGKITLTDKEILHQFNRVLKFKTGEKVVLFDGKGTYAKCSIETLDRKECVLRTIEVKSKKDNQGKIINLYFGIPKRNKFDVILEKGTEVGVSSFSPLITDRTEKLNLKKDRAHRILTEASEQSENPILPLLKDVQKFEEVIQKLSPKNTFVFHTKGEKIHVNDFKFFSEVNILIGPEGGWSENELHLIKEKGFKIYKVGDSVLKTETACIVIPFLFSM